MIDKLVRFVRDVYGTKEFIPLHAPVFSGKEQTYVADTIMSTFVSSVGKYVDEFENRVASYTNSPSAIATVNGTAALHVSLKLAGVQPGELVITQPLTFVASCNAISYCGAEPVFVDVDSETLGLSPVALEAWLSENARVNSQGLCVTQSTNQVIRACMPMHTFGHPVELDKLAEVCCSWNLALVEDAAESLGSLYKGRHTGTIGVTGALSFNGNKVITTGGGGIILAGECLGRRAKHLTTTAKLTHPYEFVHDEVGYNYRMPNINAALGCAQLEQLDFFVNQKRELASHYADYFKGSDLRFFVEPDCCRSNYWLNAVICESRKVRDLLIKVTNDSRVMTRPIWTPMNQLPMYSHCLRGSLSNSEWLAERVVNIPSSVPILEAPA